MLTVALHGNPGTAADLEVLTEALGLGADDVAVTERPRTGCPWHELRARLDRVLEERGRPHYRLLGYSWGAYHAIRYAIEAERSPGALVLVAPYIVAENGLSPAVAALLAVPGLGRWLVGRGAEARAAEFVARTFDPEERTEAAGLRERLRDPDLWLGAAKYKQLQRRSPIPTLETLPAATLVVVRGIRDAVADWAVQRVPLERVLDGARVHVVPGAGHGLPWTHPAEIAAALDGT